MTTLSEFGEWVQEKLFFLDYAPVIFTSAKSGFQLERLLEAVRYVAAQLQQKIPTAILNRTLQDAADLGRTQRLPAPGEDGTGEGAALLVVPIRARARTIGLIVFANDAGRGLYRPSDVSAAISSVALRQASWNAGFRTRSSGG